MRAGIALTVLMLMAAAIPCSAQYGYGRAAETPHWNVRAGVFFTSGDTVDDTEFTVGAEYLWPVGQSDRKQTFWSVSADWTSITTTTPTGEDSIIGEDDVTLIPILLNYKQRSAGTTGSSWQYGVGIGAYWAEDPIPDMGLDNDFSFAWHLTASYHFNPAWFVEGRYIAGEDPGDDGLFGFEIGYSY